MSADYCIGVMLIKDTGNTLKECECISTWTGPFDKAAFNIWVRTAKEKAKLHAQQNPGTRYVVMVPAYEVTVPAGAHERVYGNLEG